MIRVGIVEDNDDIRNSLSRCLQREENIRLVGSFRTAEKALVEIPKLQIDLVLMDIGLPKMNGIQCMVKLKHKFPQIHFLMFTIFEESELVFEALKAGADGYILKDEGSAGALKAIIDFQTGGAPMSRSISKLVLSSFHSFKSENENDTIQSLTPKQLEILELLASGLLNKEIADRVGCSERTVKQHNYTIYKKLQVNNRTEATRKYLDLTSNNLKPKL